LQSHRTLHKHSIPATKPYAGKVGRPAGTVAPKIQGEKVTILDNGYDWDWYPAEMQQFREMWKAGISLPDIAVRLKRPQKEVALLWLNESFEGRIQEREGGLLGCFV